ncbi:MAG TPA: 16S rRNA (cytosine(1402)-N(4))-methyltransferase RsmH [Patescibacteria group bacterium]
MTVHKTVLLKETIEALDLKPGMIVVDATLGGGGHSLEVLRKIGEKGKLIAFDRDVDAIRRFEKRLEVGAAGVFGKENVHIFHDNYSVLKDSLASIGISSVDAILADLGISSDQLADEQRGMSFQSDAPLDMRMDQTKGITASGVVNTYAEQELARILKEYGDEQYARAIAKNIVAEREKAPFESTSQLVALIERSVPPAYRHKKIHFATKTFQALRIEVNQELESLKSFLFQAVEILKPGGRLAIITFHSGEDALVKHTLRENARGCICPPEFPVCQCGRKPLVEIITRRPIVPSEDEVVENPRSRSAKLRVVRKFAS